MTQCWAVISRNVVSSSSRYIARDSGPHTSQVAVPVVTPPLDFPSVTYVK